MKIIRFVLSFFILILLMTIFFPLTPQACQAVDPYYDIISVADTWEVEWRSACCDRLWWTWWGPYQIWIPGWSDRGFAQYEDGALLEDGNRYNRVLWTMPEYKRDGYIEGATGPKAIPEGTELAIAVGFLKMAKYGDEVTDGVCFKVLFRYWDPHGFFEELHGVIEDLIIVYAEYDENLDYRVINLDEKLIRHNGEFILLVEAGESPRLDYAVWAQAELRPVDHEVLILTECPLPDATIDQEYSVQLEAMGGDRLPYFWEKIGGSLPSGLVLDGNTGLISGTPTTRGISEFTLRAWDDLNRTSEPKRCRIEVVEEHYHLRYMPMLTVDSTAGGEVTTPGEGTFTYDVGTVVSLVAQAEEGYHFVEWTGAVDTIPNVQDASTTITMEGNYQITANFWEGDPCFIATAAYGTPMAEEIDVLREFRDEYLLTNPLGQALTDLYYRVSPPMAEFINEHPSLKPVVRAGLLPAVAMSAVVVDTSPAEKMAIVGLVVLVSVVVAVWAARRRHRGPQYT